MIILRRFPVPSQVQMAKLALIAVLLVVIAGVSRGIQAQTEDVATTIKAMERMALDRADRGDVEGMLGISDPDVVYIGPFNEKPINGVDALRAYYAKAYQGFVPAHGEMSNVRVQVLGDAAVLTFNYKSSNKPSNGWNCTEVYHRTTNGWRIAHSHWSFVNPEMP
jgi:ketosteroid isomerase-like protein